MNIINVWKNKKIRKQIIITLLILFVYAMGRYIPAPGIKGSLTSLGDNSMLSLLRMFGGGSTLERLSIFSLGVSPYINASIIIQLLSMDVIPYLTELKETKKGREKMETITLGLSLVLALFQGFFLAKSLNNYLDNPTTKGYLFVAAIFTLGMLFVIGLAKLIDKFGFGEDKGISMIIFAGIMLGLPEELKVVQQTYGWGVFAIVIIVLLLILIGIIVVQLAERRIPIQTSKATNKTKGNLSHLPLKINSASVMPVIFAASIIQAPQIVTSWFNYNAYLKLSENMSFDKWYMVIIYGLLVFAFTFIYSNMQTDVNKITKDLGENGSFIPGVRPGKETKTYISKVLNSITLLGAVLLTLLAILPYLVSLFSKVNISMSGTSLIIVVGIAIELIDKLRLSLIDNKYKSFIGK